MYFNYLNDRMFQYFLYCSLENSQPVGAYILYNGASYDKTKTYTANGASLIDRSFSLIYNSVSPIPYTDYIAADRKFFTNTIVEFSPAGSCSIFVKNFRYYLKNNGNVIDRILYDYPDTMSTTKINSQLMTLLNTTDLASIIPKIFLELCMKQMNWFYYRLFDQNTDDTKISIDFISRYCLDKQDLLSRACANDMSNIRCACQVCYNNHSIESRQVGDIIESQKYVNNEPWCVYPACASGSAYKNKLNMQRSVCPNISVAGVFVNPANNSTINISNTNVSTTSTSDLNFNIQKDCSKCNADEVCQGGSNSVLCVPSKLNGSNNMIKQKINVTGLRSSKGSGGEKNKGKVGFKSKILICVILVCILIILDKFNKNIYISYLLKILLVINVCLMMYIFINKTQEKYTYNSQCIDNTCYSDNTCNKDDNKSCLLNNCSCSIGYYEQGGVCTKYLTGTVDKTIKNLCFLPLYYKSGINIYSTVINNTIYAFNSESNFKYNGNKWVEIPSIPLIQDGFKLYDYANYYDISKKSNYYNVTNLFYTFGNKVYYKCYSIKNEMKTTNLDYIVFNNDIIEINTLTTTKDAREYLCMCIVDDIMYSFYIDVDGGFHLDRTNIKNKDILLDSISFDSDKILVDNKYVYIFVNNKSIYICYLNSNTEYNIYYVNISYKTFDKIINITKTDKNVISFFDTDTLYSFNDKKIYLTKVNDRIVTNFDIDFPKGDNVSFTYFFTCITSAYKPDDNFYCASIFLLNTFLFIISGTGEIFRCTTSSDNSAYELIQCYGLSNYDEPFLSRITYN